MAPLIQQLNHISGDFTFCQKHLKQYANGKLDPEPSRESELEARVRELERQLGKVTLENEFLKKAVRNSLKQAEKKQSLLPKTVPSSKALKGGAN